MTAWSRTFQVWVTLVASFALNARADDRVVCPTQWALVRHLHDCKRWYQCNYGIPKEMPSCLPGLLFSVGASKCVPATSVWNDCPDPYTNTGVEINQTMIDYIGQYLNLQYKVLDNTQDQAKSFLQQIKMTNEGIQPIIGGNWSIYFCQIYMIEPGQLPDPKGYELLNFGVRFYHIQGCLFRMETTKHFRPIFPSQTKIIEFHSAYWSVSRTDTMPNWYVVAKNLEPRIIESTRGESLSFVEEFSNYKQWKRYFYSGLQDRYNPYTPPERYSLNKIADLKHPGKLVVPTPFNIIRNSLDSLKVFPTQWTISAPADLKNEADYLAAKLHIKVSATAAPSKCIVLQKGNLSMSYKPPSSPWSGEDYELKTEPTAEIVTITGTDSPGVFYGIQSLVSLARGEPNSGYEVPAVFVHDFPRYEYRGMFLDVGRNFHSKDQVLKLLDAMAMYKLNKFHFHLSDDEGWRLEIPGLEELTRIGSKRCHDLSERTCIISQLGSGPNSNVTVNGFYSISDYRKILQYAKDRHIEVIPEFDMPGHAHAAIKSMEARYLKFVSQGNTQGAREYLLSDLLDKSKYLSVQMYTDNAVNPCQNSTYTFLSYIIGVLVQLHKDIMPLKVYHFGGDEVGKGAWTNSPLCTDFLRGSTTSQSLKETFAQRVSTITTGLKLNLAAWEDGLMDASDQPFNRNNVIFNKDIYVNAWDNVWEWGKSSRAYRFANNGYKVIMSQATHLYFDHPYEPDPEERGFYWATRFTDTRKTFGFMPGRLYENIHVNRAGGKLSKATVCGISGSLCVPLHKPENIAGMQGHLWSETVRDGEQMFEMIFPRMLALAERAWHEAAWEKEPDSIVRNKEMEKDWTEFSNTLGYKELYRLDQLGVTYRVPPPGAYFSKADQLVKTNTVYPGLHVEYSFDNKRTWHAVQSNSTAFSGQTLYLRSRSADGQRTSRIIKFQI